jgi:hypothetical protein
MEFELFQIVGNKIEWSVKFWTDFEILWENGLAIVFRFFSGHQALKRQPCQPSKEINYFVFQSQLCRKIPLKNFQVNMNGNLICRNSLLYSLC